MSLRRAILRFAASASAVAALARNPLAGATPPAPVASASAMALGGGNTTTPPPIETGPAMGWVFPVFTDKEGYHWLTLRGSAARIVSGDQIDVTGFSAVVFSGDASERVDTVLLSPQASFFPKANRASGDSTVRVIHDDIEVTGRGWTYDRTAEKVFLAHDVRVTFDAQLNDILK